jgi:AraC-like DNA-binding protein
MEEVLFEDRRNPVNPFECYYSKRFISEWHVQAHYHHYIEMLYFVEGSARLFLNGHELRVREGDLVFVNSLDVHALSGPAASPSQHIIIKFDPELMYNTTREALEMKYIRPFLGFTHRQIFHPADLAGTDMVGIVHSLVEDTRNRSYGYGIYVRIGILQMMLWLLKQWESEGYHAGMVDNVQLLDEIVPVFEYVEGHYFEDIKAEDAARLCQMSYSSFARKFKQVMGRGFVEYVNYTRVREAERMLTNSNWSISDVATRAGFSNVSYFIKQFRRFKRISPKQFQLMMHKSDFVP